MIIRILLSEILLVGVGRQDQETIKRSLGRAASIHFAWLSSLDYAYTQLTNRHMKEAATVASLFLLHVSAMVKAYRNQVLELGVVIHVQDPNSCRQTERYPI